MTNLSPLRYFLDGYSLSEQCYTLDFLSRSNTMLDAREGDWGEDLMYCIPCTMTLGVYI